MIVVLNLFDTVKGCENQYAEYLRRVQPILDRYGAKILLYGMTKMIYMGDCMQEFCGLIAYPSLKELRALSHDPEFLAIRPLRDNSTKNYILTTIDSFDTLDDAIKLLEERAKNNTPE
ncbi:MAG: DUF1330 domain-containing protein [Phycisphaerales bacterium]|nr:DUF1330 domain-containing protein [Phycisphaerales bacterium]